MAIFSGRIVFDHLPKTGGSAVNHWLTKALGSGCITLSQSGEHWQLIRQFGGQYSIISAHIGFNVSGLDPRYQYITCLREPLDRSISWLYFVNKNHNAEMLPELWGHVDRFIATEGQELHPSLLAHISNPYVEHFSSIINTSPRRARERLADALAAIDQYDVWGLYEQFPEFIADVATMIGLPVPSQVEQVNATLSRPSVQGISPLLHRRLAELNHLDSEFYSVLRERWFSKRARWFSKRMLNIHIQKLKSLQYFPYEPTLFRVNTDPDLTLLSIVPNGKNVCTFGKELKFSVTFSLARTVEELEIGLHLHDKYGGCAFGTNTTILKRPILQLAKGTYEVSYLLVANLPEGEYSVGFAFCERSAKGNHELAWHDNLFSFVLVWQRSTPSIGYASLSTEFSFNQISN